MKPLSALVPGLVLLVCVAVIEGQADEYKIGGPLAGLRLPLFPTQYGEPAGFPGAIPEMRQTNENGYVTFHPGGMQPQEHLYPGSVEHWHAYFFKYLPIHPMFTKQSLLKQWPAGELPGVKPAQVEEYAEPVYWMPRHQPATATGRNLPAVPVVRCRVADPVFVLECGTLEPGLYALRVIGAVETQHIQRHRLPLYMRMEVNDGVDGEPSAYRIRAPYVDEFHAVAEFYFHAPVKRAYTARISVGRDSRVELLVHDIDLHDVLAGHDRRAIKTRRTLTDNVPVETRTVENTPDRLARDESLWQAFPPLNYHDRYRYGMGSNDGKSNWPRLGAGGKTPQEIAAEHGEWSWKIRGLGDTILKNDKLGLEYTLSDYRAGKALPDPYPFKDSGAGVWTPPEAEGRNPQNFWPVPEGLGRRANAYMGELSRAIDRYRKGDAQAGRDAALMLCRAAYDFPTRTARNTMHAVLIQPSSWGRDHGCRRRDPKTGFLSGVDINTQYDMLFDLLSTDQGIADSVARFIPWIKTPADVVKLMDVYLVQTTAKRCLRYHSYSSNVPARILQPAICLGDVAFTKPWLDWLFSATFVYPLPPSGIQDLMISGNDRNGMGYIASHFYAHGEQAAPQAMALAEYIRHGGSDRYDLSDPERFPKPLAACHWYIDSRTAGNYFPRIGDVCGPDKRYGHPFYNKSLETQCAKGWRWSRDPKFAYFLARDGRPEGWTDAEWGEVESAAATVNRAPWWENRSRVLINWGGFLETGIEYTDARFRRSAMVRIGQGWGHHHDDTMDLQLHAHGYPMTIDGGQRPGYTTPGDRKTRTHNLVEVNGADWLGHAWVNALTDVDEARYLRAQSEPPPSHPDVTLYSRQVALIDVDQGSVASPPRPGEAIPKDAVSPNSYVLDVTRVSGGTLHTHCFHAMLEDELTCNVEERASLEALEGEELSYAARFHRNVEGFPQSAAGFAGRAPDVLQTTWRMTRTKQGIGLAEEQMNKEIWNPESPRKFTRLHLFGHRGARVMTGWSHCTQWKYGWSNLFTQRRSDTGLDSVFPALIEPFAGEPFIVERNMLAVEDNETDARRAVALEVVTRNGHRDFVFADGRPDRTRRAAGHTFAGEFALVSRDGAGLRLATITGGTRLAAPDVVLQPARSERAGQVTDVDYRANSMVVDAAWEAAPLLHGRVCETGVGGHMTTYTIESADAEGAGTRLTMTEGADFYLSRVLEVDPARRLIFCALAFTHREKRPCPGVDSHWVASNESQTKFWRAEYLGDIEGMNRYAFRVDGDVTDADFGTTRGLRLWEYGVGDRVRQSTFAAVRRVSEGVYRLEADVDVAVGLAGKRIETSPDGQTWKAAAVEQVDGLARVSVTVADLSREGILHLRVRVAVDHGSSGASPLVAGGSSRTPPTLRRW